MRVQRSALLPPIEPWPICNRNSCDVDCIPTSHTPRHREKSSYERINNILLCYVRLEDNVCGLGKSLWTGSFVIFAEQQSDTLIAINLYNSETEEDQIALNAEQPSFGISPKKLERWHKVVLGSLARFHVC